MLDSPWALDHRATAGATSYFLLNILKYILEATLNKHNTGKAFSFRSWLFLALMLCQAQAFVFSACIWCQAAAPIRPRNNVVALLTMGRCMVRPVAMGLDPATYV